MSKTLYVDFRDVGFWAFDVVAATYIKFLVDAAETRMTSDADSWLADVIQQWRVNAAISDFGFHLNDEWTDSQITTIVEIFNKTNDTIAAIGDIPARTVDAEPIVDDLHIFLRNIDPIAHKPVVRFGKGLIDLLSDSLPEPPKGHWWYYNLADELGTIEMRDP